jgi:hypothetical protein
VECYRQGNTEVLFFFTTNLTSFVPGSKPGLHIEVPAANLLNHGTTIDVHVNYTYVYIYTYIYIHNFSPYLTENTICVHYDEHTVTGTQGNHDRHQWHYSPQWALASFRYREITIVYCENH